MADLLKPIRIAIIGAGIGGLAAAAALSRLVPEGSAKIEIYEQASEIKEIGAGIGIWPRTWPLLQQLGVAEALEKHLESKPDNTHRKLIIKVKKGDQAQCADVFEYYSNGESSFFHRAAVQKTLLDSLPPSVQVHLGHRLVSYDETDDEVFLNFENQESKKCDLLVAADGIKSHTRAEFITKKLPDQQESINPVWNGTISYRCLVSADKVRETFPEHIVLSNPMPILYVGEGKYSVAYPIMHGQYINLVALVADYSKEGTQFDGPTAKIADKEELFSYFSGWSEEYLALLKNMGTCTQWVIQYLNPLRSFAAGRVVLLGDAAHAMPPNLGAGAGQAIEDAYILARLFSKAVKDKIPIHRITKAYTNSRQPIANLILQKSRDTGRLTSFCAPGYEGINSADEDTVRKMFERFSVDYPALSEWWVEHPVEEEVEKALNAL